MRQVTLYSECKVVRQIQSQESSTVQYVTLTCILVLAQLVSNVTVVKIVRFCIIYILAILVGGNAAIGAVNGLYYGKAIRNEASSEFGKMLRTMYSIKNTEEHEYVSVTAEKLQRMYAVSPTLRQIEPEMTPFSTYRV